MCRLFVVFMAFIGLLLVPIAPALAKTAPVLNDISIEKRDDGTVQLTLSLSQSTLFRALTQTQPKRLLIDLPALEWGDVGPVDKLGDIVETVNVIEHIQYKRVSLLLSSPYVIDRALGSRKNGQFTLVITLRSVSNATFQTQSNKSYGPFAPQTKDTQAKSRKDAPFIVVIDPGHGGRDPGAVGHNHLLEKDVTLRAASLLKDILEAAPNTYQVHLTRQVDRYIPLYERIQIAHQHQADLFLSLHADSIPDPSVRGVSLYTLSDKATDPLAAALAIRENRVALTENLNLPSQDSQTSSILLNLAYQDTVEKSELQAGIMAKLMHQNPKIRTLTSTHRRASFVVLKAPDIPSVLIEMGFMSNAQEAALLAKDSHLIPILQTIAQAIDSYKETTMR